MKAILKIMIIRPARWLLRSLFYFAFPERKDLLREVTLGIPVNIKPPYRIHKSQIGDYSYIATNSRIGNTTIGKFCSIGPNLVCGWGIHPTNAVSTSPVFYSTECQLGISFCNETKVKEHEHITIGNDVFIGMNVSILDGVKIGDGSIIAAGAVITKDVPPYAMVGGVPAKLIKFRFDKEKINKLLSLKWWDFDKDRLKIIEKNFFDIDVVLNEFSFSEGS